MKIKVKGATLLKALNLSNNEKIDKTVVTAQLVLVGCNPVEAKLFHHQNSPTPVLFDGSSQRLIKGMGKYLKPYLISRSEKLEDRDWAYYNNGSIAWIHSNFTAKEATSLGWYKILAHPQHFSLKHLHSIVNEDLKVESKISIECEEVYDTNQSLANLVFNGEEFYIAIKFDDESHFIIHDNNTNATTMSSCSIGVGDGSGKHFVYGDYDTIKLLQDKLLKAEKLSKNKVIDALTAYALDDGLIENTKNEWPTAWDQLRSVAEAWLDKNMK